MLRRVIKENLYLSVPPCIACCTGVSPFTSLASNKFFLDDNIRSLAIDLKQVTKKVIEYQQRKRMNKHKSVFLILTACRQHAVYTCAHS